MGMSKASRNGARRWSTALAHCNNNHGCKVGLRGKSGLGKGTRSKRCPTAWCHEGELTGEPNVSRHKK
jgi:hypothetical protein